MEETYALIKQSHEGDKEARDILVEQNLGLVWSIVRRFQGRGHEIEDLFQIGCIGLLKAIDKFDLSYDVKFSTYAVPMIAGEIKRFLRDDGIVKVSRSVKENAWKIRTASDKLTQELGRDATIEEISLETNILAEDIVVALEAGEEVESIYKTIYQSDGNQIYMMDRLPEKKDYNEILLNQMLIEQMLGGLSDLEREIIELRYFKDKTQIEVANQIGISQVQVSRMEKKILLRMRNELGSVSNE